MWIVYFGTLFGTWTVKTIQKLNFELLPHPPYSPNLAPSDYHLFDSLKKALRGRRFRSDEEVRQAVHTWLCDQTKTFFSDGIKKLVERCKKCVDKQGDFVEK
jgi:histone-lysine N-methyltransferase SETMAR